MCRRQETHRSRTMRFVTSAHPMALRPGDAAGSVDFRAGRGLPPHPERVQRHIGQLEADVDLRDLVADSALYTGNTLRGKRLPPWERGHPCPHPGVAALLGREWAGAEYSPRCLMPLR
jgi:hypothetical protein